ncbi:MAG: 2Fe-2S iron-sulfur cluster-binding protein [Deltaproteobacteria bacterium]|nr:2Fe-2S iron-sulfur cluster-binding protein [Deltaproteobacteria bacterium]
MSKVYFKIRRQDLPESSPYWEEFQISALKGMTVSGALREIRLNPVNVKKEAVGAIVWGDDCGAESCASCAMLINGKGRLACETHLEDLPQPVVLRPLSKFPVLRDLLVDKGRIQTPVSPCTDCGLCLEACPRFGERSDYIGPSAIIQAQLANPSDERLLLLMGKGGIEDCGHFENCQKSCPEEIPILTLLGQVSREATRHGLKKFLG